MTDINPLSLEYALRYAWYVGRFLGICEILRKPDQYPDREVVIEQMLKIQDDYKKELADVMGTKG